MGVVLPLLVACSLLQSGCWAGPIHTKAPRNLKSSSGLVPRDNVQVVNVNALGSAVLLPRSGTNNSSSMWAVTAIVGVILLICLLVIVVILARRNKKRRQKAESDEELGFGQYPKAQPDLALPPKTYDGVTTAPSPPANATQRLEGTENIQNPPPPLVTISPPEEPVQKMKRIPVPLLPVLPTSPRLVGLPPSPRLIGLPPSPRLPTSPRSPRPPRSSNNLSAPRRDVNAPSSPTEVPLSAGGLERMITKMELEFNQNA